jgi:hypothetical protein
MVWRTLTEIGSEEENTSLWLTKQEEAREEGREGMETCRPKRK